MPPQRRMTGYGTAPIQTAKPGHFPLPPPPDGKPPVRLSLGQSPAPSQPAPMDDMTGQSDDQMMQLMRLLAQQGQRG